MKLKHLDLPSGLQQGLPFLIQADWTPEQALAVLELLDDLREVIGRRYGLAVQGVRWAERQDVLPWDGDSHVEDPPF